MKRKKENKTFEIIFVITVIIGIYISSSYINNTQSIGELVFTMIVIIITIFCFITGGYIVLCYALKYLQKNSKQKRDITFLPTIPSIYFKKNKKTNTKSFLSTMEKEFKNFLNQNLPEHVEIHCKVRLADILKTETTYRRVIMMHVDYVLVDKKTLEPILVIELDDASHHTTKAKERDSIKDNVLKESGIKYIRIQNNQKYNPTIMKNILEFCMQNNS